jgi:hypothetical protein
LKKSKFIPRKEALTQELIFAQSNGSNQQVLAEPAFKKKGNFNSFYQTTQTKAYGILVPKFATKNLVALQPNHPISRMLLKIKKEPS